MKVQIRNSFRTTVTQEKRPYVVTDRLALLLFYAVILAIFLGASSQAQKLMDCALF